LCHSAREVSGMASRVATNVRLDRDRLKALKHVALERGISLSALFQEMVNGYLARTRPLTGKDWAADPFFQIGAKPGRSGHSRVAEDHDRDLYPAAGAAIRKRRRVQRAVR
jgi:hypothetical protein